MVSFVVESFTSRSPTQSSAGAQRQGERAARHEAGPSVAGAASQHESRSRAAGRHHLSPGYVRLPAPDAARVSASFRAHLRFDPATPRRDGRQFGRDSRSNRFVVVVVA